RKTTHVPYRSGLPSFSIRSANCLGRVFDHIYTSALSNFDNRIHLYALAKQMHRHDCFGPRSDFLSHRHTVKVECFWIDIHKYRASAEPRDHASCCKERVSSRDHFVSGSGPDRHESDEQRIRAGGYPDSKTRMTEGCYLFLQRFHFGPQYEMLGLDNPLDRLADVRPDSRVLGFQIEQRYFPVLRYRRPHVRHFPIVWPSLRSTRFAQTHIHPTIRPGFPTTSAKSSTSFIITAPAPTPASANLFRKLLKEHLVH